MTKETHQTLREQPHRSSADTELNNSVIPAASMTNVSWPCSKQESLQT